MLNALRALGGGLERQVKVPGWTDLSAHLRDEHRELAPALARIRPLADRLGMMPPAEAKVELERTPAFLVEALNPPEGQEGPSPEELAPRLPLRPPRVAGPVRGTKALGQLHRWRRGNGRAQRPLAHDVGRRTRVPPARCRGGVRTRSAQEQAP